MSHQEGVDRLPALVLTAMSMVHLDLGKVGWLMAAMGVGIGFWPAAAIFVFATLAGGLTGAPGGVGGAEAAMFALLVAAGVPAGPALAATAVIRLTTLSSR